MKVRILGIDLAKNVFSVHGVDGRGKTVLHRELRRRQLLPFMRQLQPCLVGMEACGGAHYWAREMAKLGHEVRLMSPQFVRPYVKSNKRALILEALGGYFIAASAVETSHIELGRGVEAEESGPADVDEIQGAECRYLRLPVVFVCVDDAPIFRLFHLEFGEFRAVVSLYVLVGVAMECLVEGTKGGHTADPDDPTDLVKRDAAQPERDDLLFASGDLLPGLRRARVSPPCGRRRGGSFVAFPLLLGPMVTR
jgi:hypothetical protein